MAEFLFTNEHSPSGVADVVDVLRKPRLWIPTNEDYPNHNDWLGKTEAQIAEGTKRAMAAYIGKKPVGAVIYQRLTDSPEILEVRNISVSPDARGRYVGRFLLRNAEIEAQEHDFPGIEKIIVDTKASNKEMIEFLLAHGYSIEEVTDLYGLGAGLDVVLSKKL